MVLFLKCINFVFRPLKMFSAFEGSQHPVFGGFRALPYASVLAQVNDLDDKEYNTLPPQPPRRKAPPHPKNRNTVPKRTTPLKPKALLKMVQILVKGKRDNFLTKLTISNQRQQTIHQKMPMYGQTS